MMCYKNFVRKPIKSLWVKIIIFVYNKDNDQSS